MQQRNEIMEMFCEGVNTLCDLFCLHGNIDSRWSFRKADPMLRAQGAA
jgi:hypothetical protein